jgi:MFS family permease
VVGGVAERLGRLRVALLGHVVAGVSCLGASFTAGDRVGVLSLALFGLGLGWSLGFVAGSALLAESSAVATRIRTQGRGDALIAFSAALANLAAGALLAAGGYAMLSQIGLTLAALPPLLAIAASRRLIAPAPG